MAHRFSTYRVFLAAVVFAAAVLVAAPNARAADIPDPAFLSGGQIKILISGARIEADVPHRDNILTREYAFKPDGTLVFSQECHGCGSGGIQANTVLEKGTWSVSSDNLCGEPARWFNAGGCWLIRLSKDRFSLVPPNEDKEGGKGIEITAIDNPNHQNRDSLIAALAKKEFAVRSASGGAEAAAEISRLKQQVEIARLKAEAERAKRESEISRLKTDTKRAEQKTARPGPGMQAGRAQGMAGKTTPEESDSGPVLPPAEYKPLSVGTVIRYSDRKITVRESDGFELTYTSSKKNPLWRSAFGLFAVFGSNVYATHMGGGSTVRSIDLEIDRENREKMKSFWPIEVGKAVTINKKDTSAFFKASILRDWEVSFRVVGTENVRIGGYLYPTYVIQEHGQRDTDKSYSGTLWYHPDSGLIVKAVRKWSGRTDRGSVRDRWSDGDEETYEISAVSFPKGATGHALTRTRVTGPRMAERPAAVASRKSQIEQARQEAELARLRAEASRAKREAEMAREKGEVARLKQQAELARLQAAAGQAKRDAELARLRQETEIARLTRSLTQARQPPARKSKPIKPLAQFGDVDFGQYHALVIGNNAYKNLPKLQTAVTDAKGVAKVLGEQYGFDVQLLLNATRNDILDALDDYRERLKVQDNLLIYYAGHGVLDEDSDRGYWLPVDARSNRRSGWVSNASITDSMRALDAKHVMVVADSCYSGTLVRGAKVQTKTPEYIRRMAQKRARLALTSGGLEPVADKGGGDHSPFAQAFIDVLKGNPGVIDGTKLFTEMRRPVMVNADQTPEYSDVRKAGHDGGDFLFVRKK